MEMEIRKNKSAGFSLIELIVAMAVFSFVLLAMTGIAHSVIKGQRKAFALQEVQENGRYLVESISKGIRMGIITSASDNQTTILSLINQSGDDIDYQFIANKMQRRVNAGAWQDISSNNINITGYFYIRKTVSTPDRRALVTMVMKIEMASGRAEGQAENYLQTTLSSRSWNY